MSVRRQGSIALVGHRAAVLAYMAFAVFPLFWLLKIAVTPERLLYTEGVAMWPSRSTLANFDSVLTKSPFPIYFRNSVLVSIATALVVAIVAALAGYALSRFRFKARGAVMFLLLLTQMFPLVMIIAPIYRILTPLHLTDNLAQ